MDMIDECIGRECVVQDQHRIGPYRRRRSVSRDLEYHCRDDPEPFHEHYDED
ncbi:MAG: hypothetical protein Q6373_023560 [Candidatus Sigynarchaeota archaeon]